MPRNSKVESRGQGQDCTRVAQHQHLDVRTVSEVQSGSRHFLPVEGEVHRGKAGLSGKLEDGVNKDLEHENERLKKLIAELTIANDFFKKVLEGSAFTRHSTTGRPVNSFPIGSWCEKYEPSERKSVLKNKGPLHQL